ASPTADSRPDRRLARRSLSDSPQVKPRPRVLWLTDTFMASTLHPAGKSRIFDARMPRKLRAAQPAALKLVEQGLSPRHRHHDTPLRVPLHQLSFITHQSHSLCLRL